MIFAALPTLTIALGLVALAGAAPSPDGTAHLMKRSYTRSCESCTLSDTHYLHCYCRSALGRSVETEIDLDWCVSNLNGKLVARAYGAFSRSCNHERWLEGTTTILTASCSNGLGGERETILNLDDFIHNSNGLLTCFGILGVEGRVPGGPNCPSPHTIC